MTYCEVLHPSGGGLCPNYADRTINVNWQSLDPPITAQVHVCEHHYQHLTEGE